MCPDNTLQCRPNPYQDTYEPEILQVNRFSSELVHRHIIYSLTLLLLLIQLIMCPDNTLQCRPNPYQDTYEPEILQVNRFSSELVHRHIIYSLTLLLLLIQLIMCPDNTLQCRPNPYQDTYEPEILQVNRFSSELVHRHIIYSLTLLVLLI